ncbi:hypothetical protein PSPO01_09088 [Paraphaeosphaeria sporulosa]
MDATRHAFGVILDATIGALARKAFDMGRSVGRCDCLLCRCIVRVAFAIDAFMEATVGALVCAEIRFIIRYLRWFLPLFLRLFFRAQAWARQPWDWQGTKRKVEVMIAMVKQEKHNGDQDIWREQLEAAIKKTDTKREAEGKDSSNLKYEVKF